MSTVQQFELRRFVLQEGKSERASAGICTDRNEGGWDIRSHQQGASINEAQAIKQWRRTLGPILQASQRQHWTIGA